MVFESLLVDILNRYLKPYVKKIDSSNLNIGVWNGNVHLKQLELKEDILSETNLRLPVTIGASYVEELSLKVPWKKLARDPTVVKVSGVYLVLSPNTSGTHDYAKDRRREREAKQKKLKVLEEARKKSSKDKEKDEDSFLLKMGSHVVKNLLVKVQDIHVRFEDSVTVPGRTFAAGITLDTLEVKTTTSSWVETVVKEAVAYAYKLVELNSLAVYFDPDAQPVLTLPQSSLVATMKEGICRKTRSVDHNYVLRPLTVYAKVQMNLKPEADMKTPQVSVAVNCQQADLDVSKTQYESVLTVSQAMDMYFTRLKYVRHRPRVPFKGNIKLWWKFAYNSILDEHVKPKLEAWSWVHMKTHRDYCRLYTKRYLEKLKSVHVSSSLEKELEALEDVLDVFNIMLCRQLARQEKRSKKDKRGKGSASRPVRGSSEPSDRDSVQTPERGVTIAESPGVKTQGLPPVFEGGGERLVVEDTRKSKKGFFNKLKVKLKHGSAKKDVKSPRAVAGRVVTSDDTADAEGGEEEEEEEEEHLSKKELELLIREEEERKRFLEDIGYADGVVDVEFPPEYVGHVVTFLVEKVNLRVTSGDEQILHASVKGIEGRVDNRPSSGNLCVATSVNSFRVLGIPTGDDQDTLLVTSDVGDLRGPLLSVSVEKSPLDKSVDLRVCVNALPVKIIYEAETVDALIGAFKVQDVIHFRELTDAATASASELRLKAKKRLEVAIQQRKLLDIAVTWQSPYVIIPQSGTMSKDSNLIVVSLGHLLVSSERQSEPYRTDSCPLTGGCRSLSSEFDAYDTFKVQLTGLQALVVPAGADWLKACQEKRSPYHIVPSTGMDLTLQRSILQKDAFLPSLQLSGTVHKVPVVLQEDQLVLLLQIVLSLPLPPPSLTTKKKAVYSDLPASNRPTSPTVTQVQTALGSMYPIGTMDTSDSDSMASTPSEVMTGAILKATLPDTLRGLSESSSTLGDLANNLNVSQVIFTQLIMKLTVEEVSLDLKKCGSDGKVRDFLHAEVKTIAVELTERTWDRQGTLRIGSVDVVDYCTKDKDNRPVHVVESEEGGDGNFATVAFTMVDSVLGKEFAEKYTGLRNSATALLSRLNISLHSGTIAILLELLTSLLPAVSQKSFLAKLPLAKGKQSAALRSSSMDFKLEVEFSGVHVEVLTQKEIVTSVDVQGLSVSGSVGRKAATVDAAVKSLCVLGVAQKGEELQKMVFSEDEKMQLASLRITKFNQSRAASSATAPPDLTKLDIEAVLYVHKLRVMVLQAVIEGALDFVADVHIDKLLTNPDFMALMDMAAQAAAKKSSPSPQQTIVPVHESPRKFIPLFKASLNLSAPVIILPMALGGGMVLDLGNVSLNAAPEYKEESTVAAMVADVQLSAAQLYSVSDVARWSDPKVHRQYVMQPVQGQAQLMWALWKKSSRIKVPTLSVTGNMDKLQATLTLDVINNVVATAEKAVTLVTSPSLESIKQAVTSNAKKASGQGAEALKNVISKGAKVKREEPLSVDISVSLSSGQLLLKTSEQEDSLLSGVISGLGIGTHIMMKSNLPQVDTRITLRDIYILDHERDPPNKVVCSRRRSEKMLEMELSVVTQVAAAPRETARMTIPPAAASIKIRVLPLQVFLTAGLGLRVLDFVRKISIPKIAVTKAVTMTKEATTAAARLAKDQHIDLDIVVEAPLICVPLTLPNQALVVNMGVLTLKNQCLKESITVKGSEEGEEHTIDSVFERFTFGLDDFSINRSVGLAHSSPERSFVLEFLQSRTLWDPGHIRCTFTRHMCHWMKEVPKFLASLHLGSLRLSLGTEDLDVLLEFALDTAQSVKAANLLPFKMASDPAVQSSAVQVGAEHDSSSDVTVDKSLLFKVDFQMDSFTFNFYCGEPSLNGDAGGAYPAECCFTRLTIHSVHLDIEVTNSSRLDLNAFLQSFDVTDCRPKVQERPMGNLVIRRYHDSKETKALNRPLVSVSVTRFMDYNYLMVNANGLLTVLDVDFIKSLVDVIMELLHKGDKIKRLTALGRASEPQAIASCSLENEEIVYSQPPLSSEQTVQKKDTFKFQASLQNFRVAMVEDATKPNPTALLLRAETFAHLVFDPPKNSLQASLQLSNFGVSACSILEMDNAMTHVLLPVSVSAALYGTVDLQSVDVQVDVPNVSLSISPALVQLIQRVVKAFMPQKKEEKKIQPPPTDLWEVKKVQETAWFLLSRIRETKIPQKTKAKKDEHMEVHVRQVEVKVEGESARPLIALIASASGSISNWSTELTTDFSIHSEVTYYNEALSLWEPFLEPVAVQRGKYQPWSFQVQLKMPVAGEYEYILGSKKTDKTVVERFRSEPKFVVDVAARAPLELTVTRSAVNLLKSMVEAYTADVTVSSEFSSTAGFRNVSSAPVTVYNKIGKEYEVAIKPGPSFKVEVNLAKEAEEDHFVMVPYCSSLDFFLTPSRVIRSHKSVCSTISTGTSATRDSFDLKVPHHEVVRDIGVINDGVFYYPLTPQAEAHKENALPLVVQVSSAYGKKLVTVRSCYQVVNHLNVELDLYMSKDTSTLKPFAVLQPGEAFPFPLAAILHKESFSVVPHGFGFTIDPNTVKISETQDTVELMCCAPQTGAVFFVRVVPEEEEYADQYEWVATGGKSHTFHIRPPILLHNLLPYPADITYEGVSISTLVEPGQSEPLCLVPTSKDNTLHVKVKSKLQPGQGGRVCLGPLTQPQQCTVQPDLRQSGLQVHHDTEQTSYYNLYLYAPVWVVNNTGQVLGYSVSRSKNEHVHLADESIFFLPEADESSTVKVCIDHCAGSESTSWSKSISLKAVPSHGNVAVKQFGGEYEVKLGVHLALAKIQLTRVLTIAPYYMLSNQTKELIYIQEEGSPFAPLQIQSGETMPFPVVTDSLKVQMAIQTPSTWSKLFSFSKSHATILKLEGQIKAVIVNVEASEGICTIAFSPYYPGCTPVRVANLFRATFLEFRQAQNKNERKTFLAPGESMEYTWDDPTGSRAIHWSLSNTGISFAISTSKDGSGSFALPAEALPPHQAEDSDSDAEDVNSEWIDIAMDGSMYLSGEAERGKRPVGKGREKREPKGYWISFLDGLQRTLLFTDRYNLIENVRRRNRTSSSLAVANASFRSIGVSVVDDIKKRDILYLGLKESELIWQLCQRESSKWKTVDEELRTKLEAMYKQDPKAVLKEDELHASTDEKLLDPRGVLTRDLPLRIRATLTFLELFWALKQTHREEKVNLESMEMLHPVSGRLRRTRHGGLDIEVKVARDLKEFEGQIKSGYIQADNQLPVSLHPIILHPIPPPPSVGSYALPPFAEARAIVRRTELSNLFLVKYLGAAVQNMSVGIDFSLVAALLDMVMPEGEQDVAGEYLEVDKKRALVPLKSTVEAEVTSASTQLYIGNIEIAPVKAKVSFNSETIRYFPDLESKTVNTILGLFSTVTAFQDADFKLAALHVGHEPSSAKKLIALFQKHYISQSLFQVYAVILGLDVIGNPVSFVRGFTEGTFDLFYEPVKAGIHGDLGEGLLYGGKSFIGGTIGGVAGAGAKVTGTLGNVVAKLTFDKDHQESRIQDKGKQDSSILHRFGGLGKSLFKGVTGVVTQPVKGGKQEGAVGVIKGIGRGTAGLLLKPIGGVIDFTSSNLTSLKNTTSVYATDVERLRQPRFISGTGLRPYSAHDASGLAIFNRVTQGEVDTREAFLTHEELEKGTVVLLTNRRVAVAEHTPVIDHWRVAQDVDFTKMTDMPVVEQNAVIIYYESGGAVQQMAVKPLKDAEVAVSLGDLIGKAFLRAHSVQC